TARYASPPPPQAGPGHAPEVIIGIPDRGEISSSDPSLHSALSEYLDREVQLRALPPIADRDAYRAKAATQADLRTIFGLGPDEPLPDLSMFPVKKLAEISRYATPIGTYVDAYPVHLLTEQAVAAMKALAPESDFDVRRFRPTVLIDSPSAASHPELEWCGGVLHAPGASLAPMIPTIRCVMPTHDQPGLARDPAITRTVAAHARRCLGVYGTVVSAGRLAEGDVLRLEPPNRSAVAAGAGSAAGAVKQALLKAVAAAMPRGR
ncbi:MAG: MOSC domain-containing protein, partial [Mycobacterium sp.]